MSNSTHYKSNPMYVLTIFVKFDTSYVKSYTQKHIIYRILHITSQILCMYSHYMSNSTHYNSNPICVLTIYIEFHTLQVKSYVCAHIVCQIRHITSQILCMCSHNMSNSTHHMSNPMYVLTLHVTFDTLYLKSYICTHILCQIPRIYKHCDFSRRSHTFMHLWGGLD